MPDQFDAMERTPGEPSGHEFTVLLAQVVGETGMQPHAVNKLTGAAGPFQFVKNTWLAMVKHHRAEMGIKPELIRQIGTDAKGRMKIEDPDALKDVLDLRHDVALSARMASTPPSGSRLPPWPAPHRHDTRRCDAKPTRHHPQAHRDPFTAAPAASKSQSRPRLQTPQETAAPTLQIILLSNPLDHAAVV